MVKIRYAGDGVALSSQVIIRQAITNTSAKFDNNIIANRFEQTTFTVWEVTIKCVSSRGRGAKRGVSERRTSSCCWHAWGTFFDELFKLNPRIVIVARGSQITRESGNWVDRNGESGQCDCEANGWVRESLSEPTIEHTCNASCRHNSVNNGGVLCNRECRGRDVPGWEPYIPPPTVNRECSTCRYSCRNTGNGISECPGACSSHELWELYTPTPVIEERYCGNCRHSMINNGGHLCTRGRCISEEGNPRWELYTGVSIVVKSCATCKFSVVNGHKNCYLTQGRCHNMEKWQPLVDDEGFNPDLYLQQPQVMPEEKGYMGTLGSE